MNFKLASIVYRLQYHNLGFRVRTQETKTGMLYDLYYQSGYILITIIDAPYQEWVEMQIINYFLDYTISVKV